MIVAIARKPCIVAMAAALAVVGCGSSSKPHGRTSKRSTAPAPLPGRGRPPVTIGSKNFTEEFILGELYSQALRAKGFRVTLANDLGASEVIDRALARRRIDAYPEYSGTILSAIAHDTTQPRTAADAYARAQAFERGRGLTLLAMAPAQDTDVLATTPAYARSHGLGSLADLRRLGSSATLGAAPEFATRFNGRIGLERVYGVSALRFRPLRIGTQYRALDRGAVQVAAVFTTDGQLSRGGYALLADPRNIFGFQNVTFVIRRELLAREGPAFQRTIDAVSAKLSTQALRVMNAAVDLDQQAPVSVARQFLVANGLA